MSATVVLTYTANATGVLTASALAALMATAATDFWTDAKQELYAVEFDDAVPSTPSAHVAQVAVTLILDGVDGATFLARFPSVDPGNGPFPGLMAGPLGKAILQPVLTQPPVYSFGPPPPPPPPPP